MDYKIEIFPRQSNIPRHVFSNVIRANNVLRFSLETKYRGGCDKCKFEIDKRFGKKNQIRNSDKIKIWLGTPAVLVYTGFIYSVPSRAQTARVNKYEARGYSELVKRYKEDDPGDSFSTYISKIFSAYVFVAQEKSDGAIQRNSKKIAGTFFEDNFSNTLTESTSEWDIENGDFSTTSNYLQTVFNSESSWDGWHELTHYDDVADCTISTTVYYTAYSNNYGGIFGRYADENNYYRVEITPVSGSNTGLIKLFKNVAGSETQIGSTVNRTINKLTWYDLELKMNGSTIEVWWNSESAATISETDTAHTSGTFGIRHFDSVGGQARFGGPNATDSFRVSNDAYGVITDQSITNFNSKLTAFDAIYNQLAISQGRFIWGIDAEGEFYFRPPVDPTDEAIETFTSGVDIFDFELTEDLDGVANELLVSYGTNAAAIKVSSSAGRSKYGTLMETTHAPSLKTASDVTNLYAAQRLNETLNPELETTIEIVEPKVIEPFGNIRIVPNVKKEGDMEVLSFEGILNDIDTKSVKHGTIYHGYFPPVSMLPKTLWDYCALRKINSGEYDFIDQISLWNWHHGGGGHQVFFNLYTVGSNGEPDSLITPDAQGNYTLVPGTWHRKQLLSVGVQTDVDRNTEYWVVGKAVYNPAERKKQHMLLYYYHDNIDSGSTQVYLSQDGQTWTPHSNFTIGMRVEGSEVAQVPLQFPISSVKYDFNGSTLKQTLQLGKIQRPLDEAFVKLATKIKDVDVLQQMWR